LRTGAGVTRLQRLVQHYRSATDGR